MDSSDPFLEVPPKDWLSELENHDPKPAKEFDPTAHKIIRKTNIQKDEFNDLVRRGHIFVIDDALSVDPKDSPFMAWTCEDFAKKWPTGDMKSEYSPDDKPRQSVGGDWWKNIRVASKKRTNGNEQHISEGAAINGPYVWHVKDETPAWMKKEVQENWRVPYFLQDSFINNLEAMASFEFWFNHPKSGALSHADSYCEMTVSCQYKGDKEWRIMNYPKQDTVLESVHSFDGQIYGTGLWKPEVHFTVRPGGCVVFPPGYMHETYLDPASTSGCMFATTFNFRFPQPVEYVRNFLPRFFSSHLIWEESCYHHWMLDYMVLTGLIGFPSLEEKFFKSDKKIKLLSELVFKKLDVNPEDGFITLKEIREKLDHKLKTQKWFRRYLLQQAGWARVQGEKEEVWIEEYLAFFADDIMAYNDLDKDAKISPEEHYRNLRQLNILQSRKKELNKVSPPRTKAELKSSVKGVKEVELNYIEEFRCEEGMEKQCEFLKENVESFDKHFFQIPAYEMKYMREGEKEDDGQDDHDSDDKDDDDDKDEL